jgi:hypothetical protein
MSHRRECPDPLEARREGERAYENGFGSSPYRERDYSESYDDRKCRERADSEFSSGYYAAERRAEEQQEEERFRRAAQARRDEDAEYEAQYEQEQEHP